MRIYLAGAWERRSLLRGIAGGLAKVGHEVVSSWLTENEQEHASQYAAHASEWSERDFSDIDSAQLFVTLTEEADSPYRRGGRHVELGYALARGKTVAVIGPRETTFHYLVPEHRVFFNWVAFGVWLGRRDMV